MLAAVVLGRDQVFGRDQVSGRDQNDKPRPDVRVQIHKRGGLDGAVEDSLLRIDIQVGALDSILKNLPIPDRIEIDDRLLRLGEDSMMIERHSRHRPPMRRTERRDIVKFGEDVIVGRNETVNGDVVVVDGNATIYGTVQGGVVVVKGNIRLASTAWVDQDLVCLWGNTDVDPGARAGGTNVFNFGRVFGRLFGEKRQMIPAVFFVVRLMRTVFLLAVAVLIVVAFPESTRRVRRYIEKNYAKSLAAGLITLLLLPFLFFVLVITILGIPIAVLLLPLAVIGAFMLGLAAFAFLAGEWLFDRFRFPKRSAVTATAVGILLFELPSLLSKPLALFGKLFSVFILIVGIVLFLLVWTPAFGAAVITRFGKTPKNQPKQA